MKKFGIIVLCLFMAQMANCQWIEFGKKQGDQNEIITFLKQDKTDIRKNADGTPFFKTAYKFEVKTGGKELKIKLKDQLYIDPENPEMVPSLYVDDEMNRVYIFIWEKDEEFMHYGMNGYIYEYNIKSKKVDKKILFEKANFGWFPYFTKGDDGQLFLRHFSYAGRVDMISFKNKNGKWITRPLQNITPEEAKERYLKQI
ncbi:hypothetical protein SAMN05444280_101118 [Tangfeifania diversioriginum]|uniref:Lipoprotein n=1 Tax=Tangfeifania diversioriginum TaxID=1168035 RepID=A0A1M6A957_9BACT|nr:hypothetical protein [Tangfeifania diversioriginum]SHI32991.1 hypothetical protein SAMN05444280_101118 [Tangfeifania diversioriginum]